MTRFNEHTYDLYIFALLVRLHHLTANQMARELGRQPNNLNRRLKQLHSNGYVGFHSFGSKNKPYVWFAKPPAHQALIRARWMTSQQLEKVTVRTEPRGHEWQHELELNNLLLAFLIRLNGDHGQLVKGAWTSAKVGQRTVEPDAVLYHDDLGHLFVELDRGHKPIHRRRNADQQSQDAYGQLAAYRSYLTRGLFKDKYGADCFRVLVTVPDLARRNALIKAVSDHPDLYSFALYHEALDNPLGPVWLCTTDVADIFVYLSGCKGSTLAEVLQGSDLPDDYRDVECLLHRDVLRRKPVMANGRLNMPLVNKFISALLATGRVQLRCLTDKPSPSIETCPDDFTTTVTGSC